MCNIARIREYKLPSSSKVYDRICIVKHIKIEMIHESHNMLWVLTCQKYFFINVWRKSVIYIYFTEFSTALTTILPILFQYCYKYCYSDSRNLWAVMKAGGLAL